MKDPGDSILLGSKRTHHYPNPSAFLSPQVAEKVDYHMYYLDLMSLL